MAATAQFLLLGVVQAALRPAAGPRQAHCAVRWDKEGWRGWEVPLCRAAGAATGTCREVQYNNLHLHDTALNPFLYSSIGASAAPLLILNIV